jgi:long-chain fatty acid transport protein
MTAAGTAGATNGYFQHGYGLKAKGMGGVSTARAVDAFGGANNPASMVWAGDRLDIGADLFSPRRESARTGSSPFLGPIDGAADSDSLYFLIPEFGYNKMINANTSLGVTIYGNGGMNTDYPGGQIPAASFCGGTRLAYRRFCPPSPKLLETPGTSRSATLGPVSTGSGSSA